MKNIVCFVVFSVFFTNAYAAVDKLFVPEGYDENDMIEVVARGHLPDACYTLGLPDVTIDTAAQVIDISIKSYRVNRRACMQVLSPFTQVIKLGNLPAGDYTVRVNQHNNVIQAKLNIAIANTTNADDHLYAPVEFTEVHEGNGNIDIIMKGRYPRLKRGCMQIVNTITHVVNGMIILQPVAHIFDDKECLLHPADLDFSYAVSIPKSETVENMALIHVRTLNGGSFNRVVDLNM